MILKVTCDEQGAQVILVWNATYGWQLFNGEGFENGRRSA